MDMTLNDREFNELQVKCCDVPLQPSAVVELKRFVRENLPGGLNEYGLTLPGFLFLHERLIENWQCDTTWIVLRKFGYNDDIELKREAPDQEQMKNYKAPKDGSASVDLVKSVKAAIEAEKTQLVKMRKDIAEDHERKKLELANEHERNKAEQEAMRKEIDDHRDKLVEDAVRKLIEKLPPQVAREFLTQVIVHV
ncbi:Rho GTPase [Artemisia annua]|uniref:Rho GTPase n=1 Tax=Artemisia annua TaxID=35608 RepID=A0A2U1KAM8_ARTAN|nr:Rho GTPase [Artemisia annua]